MDTITAVRARLEHATGLPAILDAAYDAFEDMLPAIEAQQDPGSFAFTAFVMSGASAANGRDASPPRRPCPPLPSTASQRPYVGHGHRAAGGCGFDRAQPGTDQQAERGRGHVGRRRRPDGVYQRRPPRRRDLLAARRSAGAAVTGRATFGDLSRLAASQLDRPVGPPAPVSKRNLAKARAGQLHDVIRSLDDVVAVMSRYCADITSAFTGYPARQLRTLGGWPRAAIQAQEATGYAAGFLRAAQADIHRRRPRATSRAASGLDAAVYR